jgi:hypothetical protein
MDCAAAVWLVRDTEVARPVTVQLTGRHRAAAPPRFQVCDARTPDGEPGVHIALLDTAAEQWADGVATIPEAVALALDILRRALLGAERAGLR